MIITKSASIVGGCTWIGGMYETPLFWYCVQFDDATFGVFVRSSTYNASRDDVKYHLESSAGDKYSIRDFIPDSTRYLWDTSLTEVQNILNKHADWVWL